MWFKKESELISEYFRQGIELIERGREIIKLHRLLRECHHQLQIGIYTDDGLDGNEVQALLDKIEKKVWVECSHRHTDAGSITI